MSQTLNYVLGADRRALVKDVQNFRIDFSGTKNWVQARQYEAGMRQVFVNIKHEDGTPLDLTGSNVYFEGWLPEHSTDDYRVIDNHGFVPIDPQSGKFRYDFPAQAFAIAGSYRQAFFRIVKDGKSVATLEFDLEVLADKVIGGLVPRDYISPLEDLLDQALQDFKAKSASFDQILSDLKKQFADTIADLNKQGMQVTTLLTDLQSRIEALTEKEKQAGLFTQAEAKAFEDMLNQEFQTMIEEAKQVITNTAIRDEAEKFVLDPQNQFLETMPAYLQDTFDHATTVPHGDNIVNIALITDNHHQEDMHPWSKKAYSGKSMEHYQWFANGTLMSKADVAIADGDNINGDTLRTTLIWETIHSWAMLYSRFVRTSLFMIMGNHDTGVGQTPGLDPSKAMTEDDVKNAYHTKTPLFGEVRNRDSLYFYKDLPSKKVRVIGLNSSDLPWTLDTSGMYKHNRLEEAAFGEEQLNWLANQALKLPDNTWQVIFFFHHPLSSNNLINRQAFKNIITAFKNGTAITVNANEADDIQINNLQVDFTQQGKGTVIACFNGHYHTDQDDFSSLNGTPCVVTDADLSSGLAKEVVRRNTVNEPCWDTISINTETRKIHCYRFGRGKDREYNY